MAPNACESTLAGPRAPWRRSPQTDKTSSDLRRNRSRLVGFRIRNKTLCSQCCLNKVSNNPIGDSHG